VFEPAIIAKSIGLLHRHGGFGWAPAENVEALLLRTLESRPYLLGDTFSGADIAIGGGFPFLMQATLISPLPVFKEYAQRLTARPAYARAEARDSG
jgi:glutathione S-transferase